MARHWRSRIELDTLKQGNSYGSQRAIVLEAVNAIADCDAEDDRAWHAAWCRLWITLKRLGWTPPKQTRS